MAAASRPSRITPEAYLAIERAAEFRSEYHDGRMFPVGNSPQARAGASFRHGEILGNLQGELHAQLKGGPCRSLTKDLRVALDDAGFVYPDLVIVGGDPRFLDRNLIPCSTPG